MSRRIAVFPDLFALLLPGADAGTRPRTPPPEDWRPERRHRPAGWSAARRARYVEGRT